MKTIQKQFGVAGAAEIFRVQVLNANGGFTDVATDAYTGSEELECVIWPGDDREQTTTLPATWFDATTGDVRVTFPLATMQALEVNWYSAFVQISDGSQNLVAFQLEVTPGPGSATAPKAYHTYKDLRNEWPSIGKLADQLNDQGGFAEIAAEARNWIDGKILKSVPDGSYYGSLWGPLYQSWNGVYGALSQAQDPTITAALDADQLMLTTATGKDFVRASVYWTLSTIFRRAVGAGSKNDLMLLSKEYEDKAERLINSCKAEIDTNADGIPEYVFPIARARMRRM